MTKFEDVEYSMQIDPNKQTWKGYLRFPSQYLSEISPEQFQTTHGTILLSFPYTGPKLIHNDHVMLLVRSLDKGRFQGTITKVTRKAIARYKQLCFLRNNEHQSNKICDTKEEQIIEHF